MPHGCCQALGAENPRSRVTTAVCAVCAVCANAVVVSCRQAESNCRVFFLLVFADCLALECTIKPAVRAYELHLQLCRQATCNRVAVAVCVSANALISTVCCRHKQAQALAFATEYWFECTAVCVPQCTSIPNQALSVGSCSRYNLSYYCCSSVLLYVPDIPLCCCTT